MLLNEAESNTQEGVSGKPVCESFRGRRPCACGEDLRTEPGRPRHRPNELGLVCEGGIHKTGMNGDEESDSVVVPKKGSNKEASASAETVEGRTGPKGNSKHEATARTQRRSTVSTGLFAVRQAARKDKKMKFTALLHHLTPDLLRESYLKLKRNSAAGIDGVTWKAYGENLEERLIALHHRIHIGSYKTRPAKRCYIPKADGSMRPLSIWCLEDKIVQLAAGSILNAVYEEDFQGFSYGFRPGKSQHDALDAMAVATYRKKVTWILDADIQKFFDQMSHSWVIKFLEHRIGDKRLIRLIRKWLKAGILEDGEIVRNSRGAPQGSLISPLLANIYLHYTYDLWVKQWRKRKAKGELFVVRYADDTVVGFQFAEDARAFIRDLKERLNRFELTTHPEKTRLICFGCFARERRARVGKKPDTFDFLGFTHYCSKTRTSGGFLLGRKTIRKRMRAQLQVIKTELRKRLHRPIGETGEWLRRVLTGHMNYYGVPNNSKSVHGFFYQVTKLWLKALRRRSQRQKMTWQRYRKLVALFIPKVRVVHPWPEHRFDAKTRGRSPVR